MGRKRFIVGVTGPTGIMYGVELLRALQTLSVETHLVMTRAANLAFTHETDLTPRDVHTVGRVLDLFGLDSGRERRWDGGRKGSITRFRTGA